MKMDREKRVVLSQRLTALARMVTPGYRVCDIGCDHGFLSIYLVQEHISPAVIAMDVREGPLSRAREHVAYYGLDAYIETRLSDGTKALRPGEVQTLVCAGMGGRLMQEILTAGRLLCHEMKELILQPQSELMAFRKYLREEGYRIAEENMIKEDGKYYPMIKAVYAGEKQPDPGSPADRFGECNIKSANPVLKEYLLQRIPVLEEIEKRILKEGAEESGAVKARLADLKAEREDIRAALEKMDDE